LYTPVAVKRHNSDFFHFKLTPSQKFDNIPPLPLKETYPDSLNSTNDVLPDLKTPEEREKIRKHLLMLGDQGKITFREGTGSRDSKPLLFEIRLVP